MKKLLKNKGNILFVTVIYFTVVLLGFALSVLVTNYVQSHKKQLDSLYDYYNYESCSKIIATELLSSLDTIEVTLFYSPLLTSAELQTKLQVSLRSTFLDSMNQWHYSDLLPDELNYADTNYTVQIEDYDITVDEEMQLTTNSSVKCKDMKVVVTWKGYIYSVSIKGLYLQYNFTDSLLKCKFDTSKVHLAEGQLRCL